MVGSLATMTQPRRLPSRTEIPWDEVRRRAGIAFHWLQEGWNELTTAEREEIRKLVSKSRGRPRNLTKTETRRLGQLASRAASGAAKRARQR
jgi:hypothetical protein